MIRNRFLVYSLVLILSMSIIPVNVVYAQTDHFFDDKGIHSAKLSRTTGELFISAWNQEVEIKFRLDDTPITSSIKGDKVELDYSDYKVNVYEIKEGSVFEEGGIEYELILPVKPTFNQINFQMFTKGLEFYYQAPLYEKYIPGAITCNATHAYDKDGNLIVYRPIEIVGSYAVYHSSKSGNEYKTGKAFHIYRPKLIDAGGMEEWAILNIEKDVLIIELPQDFLDSAKYPVIVDPGFGYDTVGGTELNNNGDYMYASMYNCLEAGTATSITAHVKESTPSAKVKFAVYDHGDDSRDGYTEEWIVTSDYDDWKTLSIVDGGDLSNKDYKLVVWPNDSIKFRYDDLGVAYYYKARTYNGWPDPCSFTSSADRSISVYCNYTTDGGEEYKRDLTQAFAVASNVYGYWGATRALTQALSVAGNVYRTWDATRALTQALSVAGNVYRTWDAKRVLTQAINFASTVEAILSEAATFIRDLTQAITVGSSVDAYKGIQYIRDLSQAIGYTINIDVSHILGTGWSLLTVFVKSLDDLGIPSASVSVFVVGGSNVFSEVTNSSGYTSTYNVSNANYTAMITKENYISTDTFLNLAHNTIIEVTLTHAEEAIVLSFNIELLVLAAVSMIFMLMMLFTSQPGMGVIAGTLAFVFWEATGLYYMYTNIADQWAIGYLFIGLGLICVIMTVYCGLRTLDPKAASKDSDFL